MEKDYFVRFYNVQSNSVAFSLMKESELDDFLEEVKAYFEDEVNGGEFEHDGQTLDAQAFYDSLSYEEITKSERERLAKLLCVVDDGKSQTIIGNFPIF